MKNIMRIGNTKNIGIATTLAFVFTAAGFIFAYFVGDSFQLNGIELAAVLTSYICTILCVTQNRSNYIFGVVTTFLYSILFYQTGLYAVALFNAVLVLSLIYGYWRWGPDGKAIQVTDVDMTGFSGYIAFAFIVALSMMGIFSLMGAELNHIDLLVASLSAMAQLMLDNKKITTWKVWMLVNILSIYLFYTQGLYLVMFQYIFFLGNAFVGHYMWTRTMPEPEYVEEVKFDEWTGTSYIEYRKR